MQDKLDDKEPEKEVEVPKYLPKEGTPALAIIRALRNEIPHCLQKDELKEVAQPFCAESFKETGSSSAWKATMILLKKKIISKSKKGSSEFYTLTEKGEELADLMGADEEDSRILINDLKLIGIEAAFMQKAIVRAFRSKASLVETLRERETVEQKMNVLRQTPYLIFVNFFTQAKFLEDKIYTEKTRKLRQNTKKIANFLRYYGKIHSKLPIFRDKSVKIHTGQKKFIREFSWLS